MKLTVTKLLVVFALIACAACSKVELAIDNAGLNNEKGVYGYMTPIVCADAIDTRGSFDPSEVKYVWEPGDKINIWSSIGTLLIYHVTEINDNRAKFDGGGYKLEDGETYYSSHPLIRGVDDEYNALPTPFEGQIQTADGDARHIAKYLYTYSSATCDNGNTSFDYHHLSAFIFVEATLPKAMKVKKVTLTADSPVFALDGTTDVTTGVFTPGRTSNTLTLELDNVEVTDGVLNAYLATAPLEPATYILSVTDSDGKVYSSPEIVKKVALPAGRYTYFRRSVESEEREYVKVTSIDSDPAGKYILVYPNGTTYRAFSFAKTMENAETAAASVATTAFADLYDQSSTLYNTVVGGNYVEVTGEANATSLILNPEQEAAAAITIAANTAPWTVTAPAKDLKTTLTSGSYSLGVDHLVANVASDGTADLVAAFNAPDAVTIMNSLRGHNVNVTFTDIINLVIAKTDGFSSSDADLLQRAFNKLVVMAKDLVAENPRNIFPAGSTLMNITLNTNAFDVFSQYHDNAADISWRISPEKRFGLAQLGYNVNAQGFTLSVNLPSYVWLNELNDALAGSYGQKTLFVSYWAKFDNNSQYDVKVDGVKIDQFYTKLAQRFADSFDRTDFGLLFVAAAYSDKLTSLANSYKTLAEKLNTGIQPVAIYKKVVE